MPYNWKGAPRRFRLGNPATVSPSARNIEWAAGIYEGEGSVKLYGRKGKSVGKNIAATVSQKDRWLLERFEQFFGGRIVGPNKRGMSYWHVSGARARGFLMTIYGLLSPRRREQIKEKLRLHYAM